MDHVLEKVLPEGEVVAHLVSSITLGPKEPTFLDRWQVKRALCGATIKVLLPFAFDPRDPDACPRCARHLENGTSGGRLAEQPKAPTARVRFSGADGEEIYWIVCGACHHVGQDRDDDEDAHRDVERHNAEMHRGADVDEERF